jgi:hypothetical protein
MCLIVIVVLGMTRRRAIDYTAQHGGLGVAGACGESEIQGLATT